ncbi:TonB-dependent receptor family protein [Pseudobacteriovorax antillogorgiicola]|uniref:Fe(3+) dicitrate transport protein n=1 Tax=Pseudobacteriovorax antillogorgiicola TaxID=1513793 RepID=A0A1Y6BPX8_9BACT|nr:TonB-dependent receptor [Pseudobacteriovorax antillogorgiicola]TCS55455.1 Fe(3+) dicitrate transport protein [Pseudobacteriovorax antillogorgiicola]SMF12278.1 Fe(3+) dicitrate transport protein [Pseudobacteriovorax antillogorgiicola]
MSLKYVGLGLLLLPSVMAHGEQDVERMSIIGSRDDLKQQAGSAHRLDDKDLETFSHTDIHRILKQVPGVNIQEEDGLGLRPNIGLRGAHPHRSRKVTLMEDGILIGPAPYSAPAAYYFPMMTRAYGVEVFKGPSAVRFGPNSIGGAINIMTRPLPNDLEYGIQSEIGSYGFQKVHGYLGQAHGPMSYSVSGSFVAGDGFKELPYDSDEGFKKDDIMLKLGYQITNKHAIRFKGIRAHETSFETYLGLTEADFKSNPYQRYAASAEDKMVWHRDQAMLTYQFSGDSLDAQVNVYKHWFQRNWAKFNGFTDSSVDPRTVLNEPIGSNLRFYQVINGEEDSIALDDGIVIGSNRRTYLVEGVQGNLEWELPSLGDRAVVKLGLRHHQDLIERDHTEEDYLMTGGRLVRQESSPQRETNQLHDKSIANSFYGQWDQYWSQWKWSLGMRHEQVRTTRNDRLSPSTSEISNEDSITTFGLGTFYQFNENLGFLVGVNQGVTLVGPGQADSIKPEEALNYEAGFRAQWDKQEVNLVAFYSDYSNIKGTCSFSSGCQDSQIDTEFNGGEAVIQGLELDAGSRWQLGSYLVRSKLAYTYTDGYFTEASESDNPEWGVGLIQPNDPLPYMAKHMAHLSMGLSWNRWEWDLSYHYKSSMYDQTVADSRYEIPAYSVLDFATRWHLTEQQSVAFKIDNLLDETYLVSLRPYGQRPGKPQTFMIGYQWDNM